MLVYRKIFLLFLMILLNAISLHAQETQQTTAHCLDTTTSPVPLSEVNIDGIIFLSNTDGTRAIRNSIPTSYVIAPSDHYRSFGSLGSFSPDGKWFVYPTGTSTRANWTDRHYHLERWNFINTYTGQRAFYLPIDYHALFIGSSWPIRPEDASLGWLSNTEFMLDETTVANVETQSQEQYIGDMPLDELIGGSVSPDGKHMIFNHHRIVDLTSGESVFESENFVYPLASGTGYYVRASEPSSTLIYDWDGNLIFSYNDSFVTVSQTGRWIGWQGGTQDTPSLFIMDTEHEVITDLCTYAYSITFSPDDSQVALLTRKTNAQSQLWLMNLSTWEAVPVDIYIDASNRLVGWWRNS